VVPPLCLPSKKGGVGAFGWLLWCGSWQGKWYPPSASPQRRGELGHLVGCCGVVHGKVGGKLTGSPPQPPLKEGGSLYCPFFKVFGCIFRGLIPVFFRKIACRTKIIGSALPPSKRECCPG